MRFDSLHNYFLNNIVENLHFILDYEQNTFNVVSLTLMASVQSATYGAPTVNLKLVPFLL